MIELRRRWKKEQDEHTFSLIKKKAEREKEKLLYDCGDALYMSKQSAALGLPMWGTSSPTSLHWFHDSMANLKLSLFIPGSPTADTYSVTELALKHTLQRNTKCRIIRT